MPCNSDRIGGAAAAAERCYVAMIANGKMLEIISWLMKERFLGRKMRFRSEKGNVVAVATTRNT